MKAFGYVRLSKETEDTTSPQRQRERIERLCADRGWDLVETFEDIDVSAFNGNRRAAYNRMVGRLSDVDAIVFWRLDRLSRSVLDFSNLLSECQRRDVALVSTDQPIDTSSAMGKAFVQMTAVFAELEAATISERSRGAMSYKRERGEWVGRVPYGWKLVDKNLEPDEREQAVIRRAAERYVAGESFSAIAPDVGMATAVLSRILHSERVAEALPEDLSALLVEALVARKWKRVPTSRQSLLGGIARCAMCGAGLTRSATRAARKQGRWYTYRCQEKGHVGIAGPWLEEFVSTRVIDAIDTGRLVEAMRRRRPGRNSPRSSELEARLALLDEGFADGTITRERFKVMQSRLLDRLAEARTAESDRGIDLPAELARDLSSKWDTLTISGRRQIIGAVLERIEVTKATGHGPIDASRVTLVWRT